MANFTDLPREILLHIFKYYMQTEDQFSLWLCLAPVCTEWKQICTDKCFWKEFDGTLSFNTFLYLCRNGILSNAEVVRFSKHKNASSRELVDVYEGLRNLKLMNYTKFKNFDVDENFSLLSQFCPYVREIIISDIFSIKSVKLSSSQMVNLLQVHAMNLVKLDISHIEVMNVRELFEVTAANCHNLEELYVQQLYIQSSNAYFPIESMQVGCPRLKVLRLGFPIRFFKSREEATGFPDLEIFTHPCSEDTSLTKTLISKLLGSSFKLRVIDIRGCKRLTGSFLLSTYSEFLEQLYISKSSLDMSSSYGLEFLARTRHIKVLDLSESDCYDLNNTIAFLVAHSSLSEIEVLNLSSLNVSLTVVRILLCKCPCLKILCLESCHSIPEEYRLIFRGEKQLDDLRLKFSSGSDFDTDSINADMLTYGGADSELDIDRISKLILFYNCYK